MRSRPDLQEAVGRELQRVLPSLRSHPDFGTSQVSDLCELVQRSLGLSVGRVIGSGVRGAFWSQKAVQRGLQLHVPLGQCEAQADSRIMENYPEYSHVNTLLSCFPFCPERCDFGGGPPVWAEVHGLIRWPLPSSLAPGFSLPCVTAIPTPTMLGNLPTRLMATETKLGTKKPKQTNQPNANPLHPNKKVACLLSCPTQQVPCHRICSCLRPSVTAGVEGNLRRGARYLGPLRNP